MNRTITITKRASKVEATPTEKKLISVLSKLGAQKRPVQIIELRRRVRTISAKTLRAHIRRMRDEKLVLIRQAA